MQVEKQAVYQESIEVVLKDIELVDLTVGWLGENCWIDNITDVTIGSHVCISQGGMLCTGNHNYNSIGFELIAKPITLEDGVWIGAMALVGPGVTASSHSILTAGSIATKNLETYGIYKGNPAKKIKMRGVLMKNEE